MRLGAVVQARMGSSRLPGKVLHPLDGTPLLLLLLERLRRSTVLDAIVVATSVDRADDALAARCEEWDVATYRGSLDDVAQRLLEAAEAVELDALVRVTGDSPLLDPALIDRAAGLLGPDVDVVTNVFPLPRTYPPGQSVEIVRTRALRAVRELVTEPGDVEHVTPALYRHASRFPVRTFRSDRDFGAVRLVVDTAEDAARIAALLERMERPQWEYGLDELAELAEGFA